MCCHWRADSERSAAASRFAASCRASAFGRGSTASRPREAWPAACATTPSGVTIDAFGSEDGTRRLHAPARKCAAARGRDSRAATHADSGRAGRHVLHRRRARRRPSAGSPFPPTSPRARRACARSSIRPTAATGTRSPTARTAVRASRSRATCPTTAPPPRWRRSRCARRAGASTTASTIGGSTRSRTRVPAAVRGLC